MEPTDESRFCNCWKRPLAELSTAVVLPGASAWASARLFCNAVMALETSARLPTEARLSAIVVTTFATSVSAVLMPLPTVVMSLDTAKSTPSSVWMRV